LCHDPERATKLSLVKLNQSLASDLHPFIAHRKEWFNLPALPAQPNLSQHGRPDITSFINQVIHRTNNHSPADCL
jgi:hypothetical protein